MLENGHQITESTRAWLLESADPGVRYLVLSKLSNAAGSDLELAAVKAHKKGPIKTIMDQMHPEGYWEKDGPGYLPKYRSTVWSLILLAQLGASTKYDSRINLACRRYLDRLECSVR